MDTNQQRDGGRVVSPQPDEQQLQLAPGQETTAPRKKGRAYAQKAFEVGRGGNASLDGQYGAGINAPNAQQGGYSAGNPYDAGSATDPGRQGAEQQFNYGQPQPQQQGYQQPDQGYQPPASQAYGPVQGHEQLNDRFEQMGLQGGGQPQTHQQYQSNQRVPMNKLYPSDLVNQPFNVAELDQPPPPIILPPNVSKDTGCIADRGLNRLVGQRHSVASCECISQAHPMHTECCAHNSLPSEQVQTAICAHHQSVQLST